MLGGPTEAKYILNIFLLKSFTQIHFSYTGLYGKIQSGNNISKVFLNKLDSISSRKAGALKFKELGSNSGSNS